MKKYLSILIMFFLTFTLTGCFGKTSNDDDIEDAKQQILNNSGASNNDGDVPKYEDDENETKTNTGTTNSGSNSSNNENKTIEKYTVNYLGSENFIEIDNLDKQDFAGRKVEITGKTLTDVDKIIVNFSNSTSNYPDDRYTLSQFKTGDKTFLYRAFSQYQTLDYGINEYIIEAYSGDSIARVEVTINISKPGEENTITSTKSDTEKEDDNTKNENDEKRDGMSQPMISSLDLATLPKNTDYGNPENLGGGKVGYSRIKGLELKMISPNLSLETSDEVNSFLIDNLNGWFFWNTLKSGDPLSSVYVIRLDGTKYVYEKHYYIDNGIYGVLTLESGTGVDKDNISDANIELKDKNGEFDTSNADKLFNDLSK